MRQTAFLAVFLFTAGAVTPAAEANQWWFGGGIGSNLTTKDYGAGLFARYRVWKPIYAQLEYEYLSYESVTGDRSTERETFDSVLGGAGMSLPLSRNLGFFATALYNFSYDSDAIRSPYSSEWILRTGIGYSF